MSEQVSSLIDVNKKVTVLSAFGLHITVSVDLVHNVLSCELTIQKNEGSLSSPLLSGIVRMSYAPNSIPQFLHFDP